MRMTVDCFPKRSRLSQRFQCSHRVPEDLKRYLGKTYRDRLLQRRAYFSLQISAKLFWTTSFVSTNDF